MDIQNNSNIKALNKFLHELENSVAHEGEASSYFFILHI